jgi:hypothetical protein
MKVGDLVVNWRGGQRGSILEIGIYSAVLSTPEGKHLRFPLAWLRPAGQEEDEMKAEDLQRWRTGLHAANPENARALVEELDQAKAEIRRKTDEMRDKLNEANTQLDEYQQQITTGISSPEDAFDRGVEAALNAVAEIDDHAASVTIPPETNPWRGGRAGPTLRSAFRSGYHAGATDASFKGDPMDVGKAFDKWFDRCFRDIGWVPETTAKKGDVIENKAGARFVLIENDRKCKLDAAQEMVFDDYSEPLTERLCRIVGQVEFE